MLRNRTDQAITLFVLNRVTNAPMLDLADKLTCFLSKDNGPYLPLVDQSCSEDDATLAPGNYTWDLAEAETDAIMLKFSGLCTDTDALVFPVIVYTHGPHNEPAVVAIHATETRRPRPSVRIVEVRTR